MLGRWVAVVVGICFIAGGCSDSASVGVDAEPPDPATLLFACGGHPFPREALVGVTGAEQGADGASLALRAFLDDHYPSGTERPSEWRRAADGSDRVVFLGGALPSLDEVVVERRRAVWAYAGSSHGCKDLGGVAEGWSLLPAELASDTMAASTTRMVRFDLRGICKQDDPLGPRVRPAIVRATPAQVGVLLYATPAKPKRSDDPVQLSCELPPEEIPVDVDLGEPLGDRPLVDLGFHPPRPILPIRVPMLSTSTTR